MTIGNIVDRRKRQHRFKKVNAVIEPTRHDNRVRNADRAKLNPKMDKAWMGYADMEHITVESAIAWAGGHMDLVTLYLYDEDGGIYAKRARR